MKLSEEVRAWVEGRCHHCRKMANERHVEPVCEGCRTPTLPARIAKLEAVAEAADAIVEHGMSGIRWRLLREALAAWKEGE
jgi:hypothetical protein